MGEERESVAVFLPQVLSSPLQMESEHELLKMGVLTSNYTTSSIFFARQRWNLFLTNSSLLESFVHSQIASNQELIFQKIADSLVESSLGTFFPSCPTFAKYLFTGLPTFLLCIEQSLALERRGVLLALSHFLENYNYTKESTSNSGDGGVNSVGKVVRTCHLSSSDLLSSSSSQPLDSCTSMPLTTQTLSILSPASVKDYLNLIISRWLPDSYKKTNSLIMEDLVQWLHSTEDENETSVGSDNSGPSNSRLSVYKKSKLVLMIEDVENFDGQVIEEMMMIFHEYKDKLPLTIIMCIPSSAIVHNIFRSSLFSLLSMVKFSFISASELFQSIVQELIIKNKLDQFKVGVKAFAHAVNQFQFCHLSIPLFINQLKLYMINHFLYNPLSFLASSELVDYYVSLNRLAFLSDIRSLKSFEDHISNLMENSKQDEAHRLIEDDNFLVKMMITWIDDIRSYHSAWYCAFEVFKLMTVMHTDDPIAAPAAPSEIHFLGALLHLKLFQNDEDCMEGFKLALKNLKTKGTKELEHLLTASKNILCQRKSLFDSEILYIDSLLLSLHQVTQQEQTQEHQQEQMLKKICRQVAKLIDTIVFHHLKNYNQLPLHEIFYFDFPETDGSSDNAKQHHQSWPSNLKDLEATLSPSLADSILIGLNFPGQFLNKFKSTSSTTTSSHQPERISDKSKGKRGKKTRDKRAEEGKGRGRTNSETSDDNSSSPHLPSTEEIPDTCLLYHLLQEKKDHTLTSNYGEGAEATKVKMEQLYDRFVAHLQPELQGSQEDNHLEKPSLVDEMEECDHGESDTEHDTEHNDGEKSKRVKIGEGDKGDGMCSERYFQALSELAFVGVVSTPKSKSKSGALGLRLSVF